MVILPSRGLSPFPFPFPVPALASVHVLSRSPSSISLEDFRLSRLSGSWSWIILFLLLFLFLLFFAFSFLVCPSMSLALTFHESVQRYAKPRTRASSHSLQPCTAVRRHGDWACMIHAHWMQRRPSPVEYELPLSKHPNTLPQFRLTGSDEIGCAPRLDDEGRSPCGGSMMSTRTHY